MFKIIIFTVIVATLCNANKLGNSFIEAIGDPNTSDTPNDMNIIFDESITTTCVAEINDARRSNGNLPALSFNTNLGDAAHYHSNWMGYYNCFSHHCDGEPSPGDRITMHGYNWRRRGEIIAAGQSNCAGAMNSWMNSSGHRNIILGDYVDVGCGVVSCSNCNYSRYWTCVFASPR